MANELIVKPKTIVGTQTKKKDVLSFYGVPEMLDEIVEKEKITLLNSLSCGTVVMDSLNRLFHAEDFIVEIPSGLRKMLQNGKATFDKSMQNPGAFTPNIKIEGRYAGQAFIVRKSDPLAVTQSMSNLAMMAMIQSVLSKLDVIENKIEEVEQGQKNDRIGQIIGSFKSFVDLFPSFKTPEELVNAANATYLAMQGGMAQLHLQIDRERKKLDNAPKNFWQALWNGFRHPFHNDAALYQKSYEDFVYDMQLYNRLILLSDIVLHLKGDDKTIERNHSVIDEYCNEYLDLAFRKTMDYLMQGKTTAISNMLEYNINVRLALKGVPMDDLFLDCDKEDVKYLNFTQDGSKEC